MDYYRVGMISSRWWAEGRLFHVINTVKSATAEIRSITTSRLVRPSLEIEMKSF